MYAGVPNSSASSSASQPPISRLPASLTRLPIGNTGESCCRAAIGGGSCHAMRTVKVEPPAEMGLHDGLAFALFLPASEPVATVVVLHGASSCKESHFDFARACRADGLAAVSFDIRGHGESEGALDGRALTDVASIAALARERTGVDAVALRGSSMGGYLALVAAAGARAAAVVAICPASAEGLRRGLRDDRFEFRTDAGALGAVLAEHDELRAAETLDVPLLLLHAE